MNQLIEEELSKLTFKPEINARSREMVKNTSSIVERTPRLQKARDERIEIERAKLVEKEVEVGLFVSFNIPAADGN